MTDEPLATNIQQTIDGLARRQLTAPALLYLAGHRPLAFVAGQMLHIAAPIGGMLGFDALDSWATLLSDPQGPDRLLEALDHAR